MRIQIQNPIMSFHWAGWQSDTLALQQSGWQIAVDENPMDRSIRFCVHHPEWNIYGISNIRRDIFEHNYNAPWEGSMRGAMAPICLDMSRNVRALIVPDINRFCMVDAVPQFVESEIRSIEDYRLFRPITGINEVVVEQKNVQQMLDEILKLQDPKRCEIRERNRRKQSADYKVIDFSKYKEEYNPQTDIIAQVVCVR